MMCLRASTAKLNDVRSNKRKAAYSEMRALSAIVEARA
jgi:hypothetical protein